MGMRLVLHDTADGRAMYLHKRGKKKYLLRMTRCDTTGFVWRTQDIPLCFGAVKAIAAAKSYWELYKIKEEG